MYEPFKYSTIMKKTSPLIYQWGEDNSVFFFDFDELMFQKDAELNLNLTLGELKLKGYQSVAVVECHPFFPTEERYKNRVALLNKVLGQYDLPAIYLTADWRLWGSNNSNRSFFPAWYFRLRGYALDFNYNSYQFSDSRKYNFSCCNMTNLRTEKIINYLECVKRHRDDWYLSIYDYVGPNCPQLSTTDIKDITRISEENELLWNTEVKPNLKPYKYDLLNGEQLNAFSTIFPGHTDAYCNLVVEHSAEIEIASEKSFKPFIAEQIPVYSAHCGITQFIESLGFDVFSDFVDYTKYDNIESFLDRIPALHKEIDKVYETTDITEFIQNSNTRQRLLKNKELFYNNTIDLHTLEYIKKLKPTILVN